MASRTSYTRILETRTLVIVSNPLTLLYMFDFRYIKEIVPPLFANVNDINYSINYSGYATVFPLDIDHKERVKSYH